MKQFGVMVTDEEWKRLDEYCWENRLSKAKIVREAIEMYLNEKVKEG